MKRSLQILSHTALAALGAWLAFHGRRNAPPPTTAPDPASTPGLQATAMAEKRSLPARASSSASRTDWEKALLGQRAASGEPAGNSMGFFIDWCGADPDGAVRGLAKSYFPHFGQNLLSNAIQKHGVILAPALVKHYRELILMPGFHVEAQMGRALNMLAKDDPAQAAALMSSLPSGARSEVYISVFGQQNRSNLDVLFKAMPPEVGAYEATRRSEAYAAAVDIADPQHGVWDGIAETGDPALRKAFLAEGFRKAKQSENWSGFFDAVERLDPAARDDVREAVRFQMPPGGFEEKVKSALSEECRRRGLDDWTQQ